MPGPRVQFSVDEIEALDQALVDLAEKQSSLSVIPSRFQVLLRDPDKPHGSFRHQRAPLRALGQSGTATFASAGTVAVTLPEEEPDANYRVALGPQANETMWVTNKTTTGFTLNSSNGTSTATCEYSVQR